jgi:hypothetical protein
MSRLVSRKVESAYHPDRTYLFYRDQESRDLSLGYSSGGVSEGLPGDQTPGGDLESRIAKAVRALEAIGGTARVEKDGEKLLVRGGSCPLATAVAQHPEVCQLTEALMSEIIGAKVRERCDREGSPRCPFEIIEK